MTNHADPKSVVNRQFDEIVNGRRHELGSEVFHPDMQILRMGIQQAASYLLANQASTRPTGDADGFNWMGEALNAAFPDARLDIVSQISEGGTVVTRAVFTATHQADFLGIAATHKTVSFDEVLIMHVTDGKIIEVWALADELSFLQQLGVIRGSAQN